MTTLGFYFAGISQKEANDIRAKLNEMAYKWGYVAQGGPTMGQGNAAALLVALASGELELQGFPKAKVGKCRLCGGEDRTLDTFGTCALCNRGEVDKFAEQFLS